LVQVTDTTTGEVVDVVIGNKTLNTVDITSTTTDQLRVVVIG
jgi:hypothetical protein